MEEGAMRIQQLSENLIEITQFPKIFPVSTYLVREPDVKGFFYPRTAQGGASLVPAPPW